MLSSICTQNPLHVLYEHLINHTRFSENCQSYGFSIYLCHYFIRYYIYLSYIPRSTRNRSIGDISFILSTFSRISVSAACNCSSVCSLKSADIYVIRAYFVRFSISICAMPARPFQPNSLSHPWILYALLI